MSMSPGMSMAPGTSMSDMSGRSGPSASARMICSPEIRSDVAKTLAMTATPPVKATWAHEVYTCRYALPSGPLVLTVKDLPDAASGRTYFDGLRHRLGRTQSLSGLSGLGLPAFETRGGNVAFLKDGKTLLVDASRLPVSAGPQHQSRTDIAYQIATDVLACWSGS